MISIIIPAFNRRDLLHEAVAAFADADGQDFECVIVDDASTDGTGEAVNQWRRRWGTERIRYLRQEENSGSQLARNRGIAESKGQFLLFMDSDDMPCPEGILTLRAHLKSHPDLDYCFGLVQKTDANLIPLGPDEVVGAPFDQSPVEIAGYHWHTMGALYRRECVDRVGPWNPELTGSQDWEYQARVKLFGGKGEFLDTLVGYWRQHVGDRVGTSRFRPDYVRSVMRACESILSQSRAADRCDNALETRIAKRLLVHALEWGSNGYRKQRNECYDMAIQMLGGNRRLALGLRLASRAPMMVDRVGHAWLLRRRR